MFLTAIQYKNIKISFVRFLLSKITVQKSEEKSVFCRYIIDRGKWIIYKINKRTGWPTAYKRDMRGINHGIL